MLTKRSIEIFKAIVDEFVSTAEPVGSKTLMEKYSLPYSSATIRNDMVILEELGFLEKTHTSSGRIPSTKGYRYYCEHLLESYSDDEQQNQLQEIFSRSQFNKDDAIRKSCEILSQMTNLTAGVLGPDASSQRLEYIKVFPINEMSAVVVFITDNGHTENRTFHYDEDILWDDIANCCQILNDRLKGTLIKEVVEKMQSLKPVLANQVKRHEQLFAAFVNAFIKFASENVYFSGTQNMLYQPEFNDIVKLRELMKMLDDSSLWRNLNSEATAITTRTNERSQLIWKDDLAVISSKFSISDSEEGQLMVVGPSRMDYEKIISLLEYVSMTIEKCYGKGEE